MKESEELSRSVSERQLSIKYIMNVCDELAGSISFVRFGPPLCNFMLFHPNLFQTGKKKPEVLISDI